MDIAEALKLYLRSQPAIAAVVGSGENARIFYDQARWDTARPLLVLEERTGEPSEHLHGTSGIFQSSFAIGAWGDTRPAANALADLVRVEIQKQTNVYWGAVWVAEVSIPTGLGRDTTRQQPPARSGDVTYEATQVYDIWHDVPLARVDHA